MLIDIYGNNHRRNSLKKTCKKGVLENLAIFTGEHMCWNLFKINPENLQLFSKETPTQVLSCEYCEIFINIYFEKHLQTAGCECKSSVVSILFIYL